MKIEKKLFVPSTIDIEGKLKQRGYTESQLISHTCKYHYIIHTIQVRRFLGYNDDMGWVQINFDILGETIGQRYVKGVLADLIEWGYIICNGYYSRKRKESRGYKIAPDYNTRTMGQIILNQNFAHKLAANVERNVTKGRTCNYLYKQLHTTRIDDEAAFAYIEDRYHSSLELYDRLITGGDVLDYNRHAKTLGCYSIKEAFLRVTLELGALEDISQYFLDKMNFDLIGINNIKNKEFFLKVDEYGRVHTNLTQLSKTLLQFLFQKDRRNEPLVQLDMKASQPFFLAVLLFQEFRGKKIPEDVLRYIEIALHGDIYTFLMEKLGLQEEPRSKFKKDFFGKSFYCANSTADASNNLIGRTFKEVFPTVAKFIRVRKKGGFKKFSHQLQKLESSLVIKKICKEFHSKNFFVLTKHDAVIVLENDLEKAMEIFAKVIEEEAGLKPQVTVERLGVEKGKLSVGQSCSFHNSSCGKFGPPYYEEKTSFKETVAPAISPVPVIPPPEIMVINNKTVLDLLPVQKML